MALHVVPDVVGAEERDVVEEDSMTMTIVVITAVRIEIIEVVEDAMTTLDVEDDRADTTTDMTTTDLPTAMDTILAHPVIIIWGHLRLHKHDNPRE